LEYDKKVEGDPSPLLFSTTPGRFLAAFFFSSLTALLVFSRGPTPISGNKTIIRPGPVAGAARRPRID
jgi:hypothetical protein